MIKLTINSETSPIVHAFTKNTVTLGSGSSPEVDIILNEAGVEPIHLKFQEQDGLFLIQNVAKDPFATVNGMPFGKRILNNKDIIQIGKTLIEFYGNETDIDEKAIPQPEINLEKLKYF